MDMCRINIDSFELDEILTKEDMDKFERLVFKKGEIKYPDEYTKLLIFKSGEAKVSILDGGREFILYFLSKNNIYVMYENSIIEFLEDSEILSLDARKYPKVFENPMFCNLVLNSFRNIMMLEKDIIKGLVFDNCKKRIISFLIGVANSNGKIREDGIEIDLEVRIKELANFIGSQRQTVSILLNRLIDDKIIKKLGKGKYLILDFKRLKEQMYHDV
jgi:CRP-like cAMP-binding protein